MYVKLCEYMCKESWSIIYMESKTEGKLEFLWISTRLSRIIIWGLTFLEDVFWWQTNLQPWNVDMQKVNHMPILVDASVSNAQGKCCRISQKRNSSAYDFAGILNIDMWYLCSYYYVYIYILGYCDYYTSVFLLHVLSFMIVIITNCCY